MSVPDCFLRAFLLFQKNTSLESPEETTLFLTLVVNEGAELSPRMSIDSTLKAQWAQRVQGALQAEWAQRCIEGSEGSMGIGLQGFKRH